MLANRWMAALGKGREKCQEERHRRKRVIDENATSISADIAFAPVITGMNKPRYLTSQQRACLFARYHRTQILWIQAENFAISGEVAIYDDAKLNHRRRDFLKRHDQSTGGIMGLFPLVHDLPVRFTATVDKRHRIFKFAFGKIVGRALDPIDQALVAASTEAEIMLERQPSIIYVRRADEGMSQHEYYEPEVYGLRRRCTNWAVDPPRSENWMKRFGFPLVPDLAATIHAVTGGQLTTLIGEMDTFGVTPTQEDALKGYIVMSRVEHAHK